ncbi:hypothetical protein VTN00DRAFT_9826 [Thermoascus crustaceus]|uniref:uncharacterized protein n=1 Tax=Thermoascus crustaceus TaxID=5088 RepID=UPI0037442FAF
MWAEDAQRHRRRPGAWHSVTIITANFRATGAGSGRPCFSPSVPSNEKRDTRQRMSRSFRSLPNLRSPKQLLSYDDAALICPLPLSQENLDSQRFLSGDVDAPYAADPSFTLPHQDTDHSHCRDPREE